MEKNKLRRQSERCRWCGRIRGTLESPKWNAILTLEGKTLEVTVSDMKQTLKGTISVPDSSSKEEERDEKNNGIARLEGGNKLLLLQSIIEELDLETEDIYVTDVLDGQKQLRVSTRWGPSLPKCLSVNLDILQVPLQPTQHLNHDAFMTSLFHGLHLGRKEVKEKEKEKQLVQKEIHDIQQAKERVDYINKRRNELLKVYLNGLNKYKQRQIGTSE